MDWIPYISIVCVIVYVIGHAIGPSEFTPIPSGHLADARGARCISINSLPPFHFIVFLGGEWQYIYAAVSWILH